MSGAQRKVLSGAEHSVVRWRCSEQVTSNGETTSGSTKTSDGSDRSAPALRYRTRSPSLRQIWQSVWCADASTTMSESNVSRVRPHGTWHPPSLRVGVRNAPGSGGSQSASEPPQSQPIAQQAPGTAVSGMRSCSRAHRHRLAERRGSGHGARLLTDPTRIDDALRCELAPSGARQAVVHLSKEGSLCLSTVVENNLVPSKSCACSRPLANARAEDCGEETFFC